MVLKSTKKTVRQIKKIPVGILGATGMVGQRFVTLLEKHPWFEIKVLAASPRSSGKKYKEAVAGRWLLKEKIPAIVSNIKVQQVEKDMNEISTKVSLVFSALDMSKEEIKKIENSYADLGVAVVSNNSAHRWSDDVPMILPEINFSHLELIKVQQKKNKRKGFIVVKPNCSIQSYVPLITPLLKFGPKKVLVTTMQALSGAGKNLTTWQEMNDNVIPFINGEEEKSEKEPMKIWGSLQNGKIKNASFPKISATCIRVPVNDGHMASISVSFSKKPTLKKVLNAWKEFKNPIEKLNLPSSPKKFITVFEEENRPQTGMDRVLGNGMGVSVGRLREDDVLDYKFVGLSHNTIRGAAGGAVLTAELLFKKGYISS